MEQDKGISPWDTFDDLPLDNKIDLFLDLPAPAQKLLIACSAFGGEDSDPSMAQRVAYLDDQEFLVAKEALRKVSLFKENDKLRLEIAPELKQFIQGPIRDIWEQQKRNRANNS